MVSTSFSKDPNGTPNDENSSCKCIDAKAQMPPKLIDAEAPMPPKWVINPLSPKLVSTSFSKDPNGTPTDENSSCICIDAEAQMPPKRVIKPLPSKPEIPRFVRFDYYLVDGKLKAEPIYC